MMSEDIAINVRHVSKTFHEQIGARSVKQGFVSLGHKLTGKKEKTLSSGDFAALKDVNFEVKKGEFFGIVGRNGSGKSTLLKIIAGVYTPTKGAVTLNGKLTPFIELGVGFNPELSGRDNVFLNGALLGFTRKQMEEMYEDIVDFAELKEFMDVKLKNYSSGMQVRLAFSVAIRAESEILLIDEVLAVGDAAFQQKCLKYFDRLKQQKKTVVFVTHDMASVRQFCDSALYLEKGKIIEISKPSKISQLYDSKNLSNSNSSSNSEPEINNKNLFVVLTGPKNKRKENFKSGDRIIINAHWEQTVFDKSIHNMGIIIYRGAEVVFATNTKGQIELFGLNEISLQVDSKLGDGRYRVFVGLFGESMHDIVYVNPEAAHFSVYGSEAKGTNDDEWEGIIYLKNKWRTNV